MPGSRIPLVQLAAHHGRNRSTARGAWAARTTSVQTGRNRLFQNAFRSGCLCLPTGSAPPESVAQAGRQAGRVRRCGHPSAAGALPERRCSGLSCPAAGVAGRRGAEEDHRDPMCPACSMAVLRRTPAQDPRPVRYPVAVPCLPAVGGRCGGLARAAAATAARPANPVEVPHSAAVGDRLARVGHRVAGGGPATVAPPVSAGTVHRWWGEASTCRHLLCPGSRSIQLCSTGRWHAPRGPAKQAPHHAEAPIHVRQCLVPPIHAVGCLSEVPSVVARRIPAATACQRPAHRRPTREQTTLTLDARRTRCRRRRLGCRRSSRVQITCTGVV